ncbi:MAG: PBSX family phage terminase large subunit [Blautia sp.]|nr:PBSX family phage terminase large subunit [Blautia sp.]
MRAAEAVFKFKPFSTKQRKVLNWWCDSSPVKDAEGIIADGAIRSGKTISMSLSFVLWAMTSFNGENFIMAGKTIGSFRRNVLFWLKLMLKSRGYVVEEHRADNLIIISNHDKSNYFYVFGGKDERSQDLIQGVTAAGAFFDEVALMPESFVNQATGRCSVPGSKWWFNCNPESPHHWFKEEWINKAKERGLIYLHFTMDDNLSLTEHIKERYRSQYSGVFFKRYILGLWCMAEGMIYDMFDEDRHVKCITDFVAQLVDRNRYVSIDYGTQNPTAFLLWNKGVDGVWYCCREYYYSGRDSMKQKTDSEYADDLASWLEGTSIRAVIVDPSASSFIAELRKRGYKVIKADNDVIDGIRLVGMMMSLGKLCIASSCANLIAEIGGYVWDAKAADKGEDKPVKARDHAVDAMRYFCSTVVGLKTARIGDKKRLGLR